ncbi:CmcI family methyltransferase [Fulvimarina sp. MAC3]|uniref:CmcI family methyltransferase n=1 Tax=Fulvimarina sp. MAC3 TaxID=3148887 RepID=UPI0031FC1F92
MWPFSTKKTPSPKIGSFRPAPKGPPLSDDEQKIVERFHELYYRRWSQGGQTISIGWLGYETLKCPMDLWLYQELIVSRRPDVIVETGTRFGGSALFMASVCAQLGHGRVVSIDIDESLASIRPSHERITYLSGSSVDETLLARVSEIVDGGRCMVILDSDHRCDHVLAELRAYAPMVKSGDYLVVEDTNVNGHPALPDFGPGPMEALDLFLAETDDFASDPACERFLMTLNPKGYLKRRS